MLSKPKNIATLIMAAGSSSRMGEPKQLLKWKDTTLIETAISTVLELHCANIMVILGAHYHKIKPIIENYAVKTVYNKNWKKGLGNSIAFGVNHIKNNYQVEGVLVVLADQPLIHSTYLKGILDIFETDKNQIIATNYQNRKLGVPALFDKSYFQELSSIDGDKGAKSILEKYSDVVITTTLATNVFDIDTEEDYKKLKELL